MTTTAIVMAKAPQPGAVKTRLEPLLGAARCAELQTILIRHIARIAGRADRTVVAVTPEPALADVAQLLPAGAEVVAQRGADLGERMAAAVSDAFGTGASTVVVVGTDLPALTTAALDQAFGALDEADLVLGPAVDGGYWLIGTRRPLPQIFALEAQLWGGPHVLSQTLGRAADLGLHVHLLDVERDLDTPADAAVLAHDARTPRVVRDLLDAAGAAG